MDHQRQAVFQEPLYPPESGEYLRESAYWDGIKQTSLQQFGVEGELDVMRITASYGGPFAFYHPPSLGLRHYDRTWPEVLDSHDSVEALPVGVVAGQECVVLACAQDSSPIRLVVWFDLEKSLLALRVLWCRPTDTSAGIPGNADVPKVIRIGDRQYEPFRRTEVLEFSQVGSGVWLPSKAIVQSGEIGDEFARSVIEMDLQNSIINEPVDEARFTIEPAGPTLVDDQVEDRSYEISGSPDGLTAMDRQFAENLRLIAEEDTGVSIVVESIHHPFYRSSCGPNAVLLSIALQGVPPDLEGILAEVPPNERECSFATLQSMTERRGL